MIDFHSHLLSQENILSFNLGVAIEVVKAAQNAGYRSIILTPKYTDKMQNVEGCNRNYWKIQKELAEKNLKINVYFGGEIEYFPEIISFVDKYPDAAINGSKYILVKFPFKESTYYSVLEGIFQLEVGAYRPILSHAEKYDFIIEHPHIIKELIRRDVIIQVDCLSILGTYGEKIKKTVKTLLKDKLVHILGTNASNINQYEKSVKANKIIKKMVGQKQFNEISINTNAMILENRLFYPEQPSEDKKKMFGLGSFI